jgi:hypothetical protein
MARVSPRVAGVSVLEGMVNEALSRLDADNSTGDSQLVAALVDRLSRVEWGWDTNAALFSPMALP